MEHLGHPIPFLAKDNYIRQMMFWILGMMCVNLEKTVDCFRKNGAMEDGKDALLKKRNAGL